MSKQLLSKTQKQIQNSIKDIEPFELPLDGAIDLPAETKEEWLAEMAQEEANMTPEQKQAAEQQGQAQLERMYKANPQAFKRYRQHKRFRGCGL